jgi:hypothetical protein
MIAGGKGTIAPYDKMRHPSMPLCLGFLEARKNIVRKNRIWC